MVRQKIRIGTSGWHYSHWKGPYYPKDLGADTFLEYYCRDFTTVEVNNTFYRLPSASTVSNWRDSTPKNFLFSVKMSRYVTHTKRLKAPKTSLRKFFSRIDHFEEKLGIILIQLPPNWKVNVDRLASFLDALPQSYRYTFEFRDESWLCEKVLTLLKEHGCALCLYEIAGKHTEEILTTDFTYIRLHGPGKAYQGSYSTRTLEKWAKNIQKWRRGGKEVFCYFDNDEKGFAPKNAMKLRDLLKNQQKRRR